MKIRDLNLMAVCDGCLRRPRLIVTETNYYHENNWQYEFDRVYCPDCRLMESSAMIVELAAEGLIEQRASES
jgi:hypothetical protein